MDYEAFLYLWFDSKNRKFYLGYHKGHVDDSYTHSSSVMESFSKSNIPSHMRRRIIARGSCEDMMQLEVDLLNTRKEKCWDKYYNVIAVFPPPPMVGPDNPNYIHGRSKDPEYQREWHKKHYQENAEEIRNRNNEYYNSGGGRDKKKQYRQKNREKIKLREKKRYQEKREEILENSRKWREENLEYKKDYNNKYKEENREKIRAQQKEYYQKNREKRLQKQKEYYQKNREKRQEYEKKRSTSPERKEWSRQYRQKNLEKLRAQDRARYRKKKAEKKSTLEDFFG